MDDSPTNSSRTQLLSSSSSNPFELLSKHISELKTMLIDFNQKLTLWKYKI